MELVIDRGVKSYDVKDIDGTLLGVIKINPADIGISGRFVSARNAIAELAEQAKQDMTPEKILAMDTTIKAELNKVFGSDVSSVFFGGLSALALADDGAFVFEKVLEAVAPLVEEAHKAGIAAAESLGIIDAAAATADKNAVRQRIDVLRSGPFGEGRRTAKAEILKQRALR